MTDQVHVITELGAAADTGPEQLVRATMQRETWYGYDPGTGAYLGVTVEQEHDFAACDDLRHDPPRADPPPRGKGGWYFIPHNPFAASDPREPHAPTVDEIRDALRTNIDTLRMDITADTFTYDPRPER